MGLIAILFILVMLSFLSTIVFAIGFAIGSIIKYFSELTGHKERLFKPSIWFCICLAIAAFLLEYITVAHLGYVRSVKEHIAFPPNSIEAGGYYIILMPAAMFLLYTLIRSFFVEYKEYSTTQYTFMGINLQIAALILINAIANILTY